METDVLLAAACGLYCGNCEYLGDTCPGCGHAGGKPFWVAQAGLEVCPVHGCAVEKHDLEHCGLCGEFPCDLFISMRDPSMNDEEYERSLAGKKANLVQRREVGTEAWLAERRP